MNTTKMDRRSFLKWGSATLAVAAVGVGVKGYSAEKPNSAETKSHSPEQSNHRWAMVIDQSKCTGCDRCVMACSAHNDVAPDMAWTRIEEAGTVGDRPVFMPIPCQQCQNAPCVDVCPVKANHIRPDGIVTIDYDRCIGCRYCQIACPYDARKFNWEVYTDDNPAVPEWGQPDIPRRPRGVVEKCSFCYERIDRGLAFGLTPGVDQMATPACVVACPTKARIFGDLNDPESPVSKALATHSSYRLREELGTETRVYYLPADEAAVPEA
ncbi:MAG: 4Fe-4S dicluster domain-containing protein [Anaerolineae bacterium]|nr:4Fe-4S dicluster domain-containing protein [Anaerolineae bacterium]MCO5194356.1 4Fe-4S dicluster domain-containing protein [Anaerolineae bacterium]